VGTINAHGSMFNMVQGNQYNITNINHDNPRNTPPFIAHRIIQMTTTLKTTNHEAIASYLGVPAAEIVRSFLIIQTYVLHFSISSTANKLVLTAEAPDMFFSPPQSEHRTCQNCAKSVIY
jgi:hypothetical protein